MASIDSKVFKSLALLFNSSQESSAGHEKLVLKCQQLYREVNYFFFEQTFSNKLFNDFTFLIIYLYSSQNSKCFLKRLQAFFKEPWYRCKKIQI
jgi:hypothetical protein